MYIKIMTRTGTPIVWDGKANNTARGAIMQFVRDMNRKGFLLIGNDIRYEAVAASEVVRIEVTT